MKPKLLDLFCGAGGASRGYDLAGFDVYGIDIQPQPNYPYPFIQGDALNPPVPLASFDLIHASPPCQAYVALANKAAHPQLIEPTRVLLESTGVDYVIENVVGAPVRPDLRLCGSSFGLGVRRHRLFELSGFWTLAPTCRHAGQEIRAYYGKPGRIAYAPPDNVQKTGRRPLYRGSVENAPADMGIDWMDWDGLREAIPPAYTRYIGEAWLQSR